jgi:parallel beta-helix repeat protein
MINLSSRVALGALLAAAGVVAAPATAASADGASLTFVSPTGQVSNDGTSCDQATFTSIQAAVTAADTGGTVVVCTGTYHEGVTVPHRLTLIGEAAVVDATGFPYGIGLAADGGTVKGFTVMHAHADMDTGAPGDGIVTAGLVGQSIVSSSDDVIVHNTLLHNDGAGIDLESTVSTDVSNNVSKHNGIGINVSNDAGTASSNNRISGNIASNNPGGCGIVLADHSGTGVFGNLVTGNTIRNNGLGTPSAPNASSGSGIILAYGGPPAGITSASGAYDNDLTSNVLAGNGHAGVAVHGHAPGVNFSGNRIEYNTIGRNNLRTDYRDKKTTGLYFGVKSAVTIAIRNNLFMNDRYGVFTAGPVKIGKLTATNSFRHVHKTLKHITTYNG